MKNLRLVFSALMVVSLFFGFLGAPTAVVSAESAAVVTKPVAPVTISPILDTVTNLPTYVWTRLSNATIYHLQVRDSTGKVVVNIDKTSSSVCSTVTNRCVYMPSTKLSYDRTYKWTVYAKNSAGSSAYSPYRSFIPRAGFISSFTNTRTGWVVTPGSSWKYYKNYAYFTTGSVNKWSSISYTKTYSNFTFEARIGKWGSGSYSSGLIFRGTPTYATDYDWKNTYSFLIGGGNTFGVFMTKNGSDIRIKDWTVSSYIVPNSWNILKVVTDGMNFRFFINGHLVWSDTDDTFSIGRIGITSYRKTAPTSFLVDWAKLSKSIYYTTAAAALSMPNDTYSTTSDSGLGKEGGSN